MGLWRAILHGFGFTIGAEAAKDAIAATERALDDAEEPTRVVEDEASGRARERAEAKAREKRVREEEKRRAREAKEIDAELRALKKRIGDR
jgi:hypothetical protein